MSIVGLQYICFTSKCLQNTMMNVHRVVIYKTVIGIFLTYNITGPNIALHTACTSVFCTFCYILSGCILNFSELPCMSKRPDACLASIEFFNVMLLRIVVMFAQHYIFCFCRTDFYKQNTLSWTLRIFHSHSLSKNGLFWTLFIFSHPQL